MDVKIGGKIERRAVLIGIVSRSIGCARQYPGIYTKVSSVLRWIQFRINKKAKYRCSYEIKEQSKGNRSSRKKPKKPSKKKRSSSRKTLREKKTAKKIQTKKDYIIWGKDFSLLL